MLEYLVTSKVRRRLLALLWGEGQSGSASELAERAEVAFASAHSELKEMQRALLVVAKREGNRDVFTANLDHPEAETLKRLVASDVRRPLVPSQHDDLLKGQLKSLGAPLRGVEATEVPRQERLETLVKGVELARRDPVVAKSLPLCFWRAREDLNQHELSPLVPRPEDKHALGFFLELTSELGGDRRLLGVAEAFRDRRVTSTRPFFMQSRGELTVDFPLAARWGFTMNLSLDSFRSLFEKFSRR